MLELLTQIFSFIASAGGGGSSSGGGGGGGGGSSGGSSGGGSGSMPSFMGLFMIIMFPVGAIVGLINGAFAWISYRRENSKIAEYGKTAAIIAGVIITIIGGIVGTNLYVDMKVQERQSYNDELRLENSLRTISNKKQLELKEVGPHTYDYIIGLVFSVLGSAAGTWLGIRTVKMQLDSKISTRNSRRRFQARLANAAAADPAWNTEYLLNGVRNVLLAYQRDWSDLDIAATQVYLTERYYQHVNLMLTAFRESGRVNNTIVHSVNSIVITKLTNSPDDTQDQFTAHVTADITDQLMNSTNGKLMSSARFELAEDWQFMRDGNTWRLDGINPSTAAENTRAGSIQRFAETSGAYYSLDWGRMLLPERGQIFGRKVYQTADVNNHVIGRMQSTGRIYADDVIYQIYTYSERPYNTSKVVYLVGQMFVPKSYGNILLARTDSKLRRTKLFGLTKVELEWGDFNRTYQVYATSPEQVTAFELLHPTMMQTLVDAPFQINIEVIDNAIYFYAPLRSTKAKDYRAMLSVLQAAYRELKL